LSQPFSTKDSAALDYHLHVGYEASDKFVPFVEVNGLYYTANGDQAGLTIEGGDLINLGAGSVRGNSVVTGALGCRYLVNEKCSIGIGFEDALTSRDDLLETRWTIDAFFLL